MQAPTPIGAHRDVETEAPEPRVFEIPSPRWDDFLTRWKGLCTRARKLGVAEPSFEELEERRVPIICNFEPIVTTYTTKDGRRVTERPCPHHGDIGNVARCRAFSGRYKVYKRITIDGGLVRLPGWDFLATVEKLRAKDGSVETLLHLKPGADDSLDLSEFRGRDVCDHCNTRRYRKETYLVRKEETGEVVQVGSRCIRDYLGTHGENIARVCGYIRSLVVSLEDEEGLGGWGSYVPPEFDVEVYLSYVARTVRDDGGAFLTRKAAPDNATADRASEEMMPSDHTLKLISKGKRGPLLNPEDEDRETAKEINALVLSWTGKDAEGNYRTNLQTVFRAGLMTPRHTGLVASAFLALQRAREVEAKRKARKELAKTSAHVGTVGERLEVTLKVTAVRWFSNAYGDTALVSMIDASGNVFKTWNSGRFGSEASKLMEKDDTTVTVRGTVKKHDVFQDVKETLLARVSKRS